MTMYKILEPKTCFKIARTEDVHKCTVYVLVTLVSKCLYKWVKASAQVHCTQYLTEFWVISCSSGDFTLLSRGRSLNALERGFNNRAWTTAASIIKSDLLSLESIRYTVCRKRTKNRVQALKSRSGSCYEEHWSSIFPLSMNVLIMRAITDDLFSVLNFALRLCRSAHLLSRYRPRCPIVAVTRSPQVHSASANQNR